MKVQEAYQSQSMISLFPLGVVLLPQMTLPLRIFEERYKVMVGECLDREEPFGIVYFDGKQAQKVGCTATIIRVLKRYEDGRMDILTQGQQRFFIDGIDESRPYLQGSILYIDDEPEEPTGEDEALVHEALHLLRRLDRLSGNIRNYGDPALLDPIHLSFLIPSSEGFTLEEKQQFLEMTSPRQRLRKGMHVLRKVIERTKINQEIRAIMGGNGNIKKLLVEKGLLAAESSGDRS